MKYIIYISLLTSCGRVSSPLRPTQDFDQIGKVEVDALVTGSSGEIESKPMASKATGSSPATATSEESLVSSFRQKEEIVIDNFFRLSGKSGACTSLSPNWKLCAQKIDFLDTNQATHILSGKVMITKALDESILDGYALYWGSDATTKLENEDLIKDIPKTGLDLVHIFTNEALPENASHLLVFTKNSTGEMEIGVSVAVVDKKEVAKTINALTISPNPQF